VPKSSKQFTSKRKRVATKASTFCIENGRAVSSYEVAEEVKKAFDKWQALRAKDWIPPPRTHPADRPGWTYCPKETK
jgi:hypothetical protein